ncbi:hypothetical protein RIF29_38973 [Crotalaria pallida]|uniref:Uncharacterized protein n=1 Tax=Crotalaria pallida TaxID=3830 RepID=A0AAN9HM19_CROPI
MVTRTFPPPKIFIPSSSTTSTTTRVTKQNPCAQCALTPTLTPFQYLSLFPHSLLSSISNNINNFPPPSCNCSTCLNLHSISTLSSF